MQPDNIVIGQLAPDTLPRRGRKPKETPIPAEPDLDLPRIDNAMAVMRETTAAKQAETISETFDLGRFVGAAQMASVMNSFCAAAQIRAFTEIKKSKAFKHIAITQPDGNLRPAQNVDEFCRTVFGRGYRAMQESEHDLDALGESTYEAINNLGISRSQMRLLMALPEDERAAVDAAVKSGEKSEVVSLIQDLANKLDETRRQVDELKAEAVASEELLATRSRQRDEAEAALRKKQLLPAPPPSETLAQIHTEFAGIQVKALGALRAVERAVEDIKKLSEEEEFPFPVALLAGHIGELRGVIHDITQAHNLPEVSSEAIPEFARMVMASEVSEDRRQRTEDSRSETASPSRGLQPAQSAANQLSSVISPLSSEI
ncbi:MAG: hypothetical protein LBQ81_12250 [Zoogloeaceae bacterium]|jgi:hypothetical protein|nr:hypothetical protein [Zoogloeaceae bacterium]